MSKKKSNRNSKQIEKKKQKKLAVAQKEEALKVAVSDVSDDVENNDSSVCVQKCEVVPDTESAGNHKNEEAESECKPEEFEDGTSDIENTDCPLQEPAPEKSNSHKGSFFLKDIPWKDYAAFVGEKLDDIWNFISETRKISVPLIILVYTAIVVAITIPIEHARLLNQIHREANVIEEIRTPENTSGSIEKDFELVLPTGSKVIYKGYEFTDTVKATNSDDFGSTYENASEVNTYLDIKLQYVHNGDEPISADKVAAMTLKAGGSQYASFAAMETDEGKNIEFANNVEIAPGDTVELHYIFDVPKDIRNSGEALSADVVFDKTSGVINIG